MGKKDYDTLEGQLCLFSKIVMDEMYVASPLTKKEILEKKLTYRLPLEKLEELGDHYNVPLTYDILKDFATANPLFLSLIRMLQNL